MNRRRRRTLEAIFEAPTRSDVTWREVEALLGSLGAETQQRSGSRGGIRLHGARALLHTPHPGPCLDRGAVVDLRRFLTNAGVTP